MHRRHFALVLVLLLPGLTTPIPSLAQQNQPTYDAEDFNFGLSPVSTIHGKPYDAPTPLTIDGARTITTLQLRAMLAASPPPVLIDVVGGAQSWSLPGAVWLKGAGLADRDYPDIPQRLTVHLAQLTGNNRARAIVFFCLSKTCWLSHNAALRALQLGYTNIYWYRGGRNAWTAAGLPTAAVRQTPF